MPFLAGGGGSPGTPYLQKGTTKANGSKNARGNHEEVGASEAAPKRQAGPGRTIYYIYKKFADPIGVLDPRNPPPNPQSSIPSLQPPVILVLFQL